jgi:iron complex outermembrane receptor protein
VGRSLALPSVKQGDVAVIKKSVVAFLTSIGVSCFVLPAFAQPQSAATTQSVAGANDSSTLDELVVTARKRSESLENVPVAVSVVTATQLANNDASDLTKIAEITPTVFAGQIISGTGAILSIRGIGSSPSDSGIDSSVAVDIDGVQLSRGRIITESYFDLRQVEILEGPQALFFGKNSPAGVISIHSADPTNTFESYLHAGYEFEAREKFGEGAVSFPISDTLQARVAFRASGQEGWMKNDATSVAYPDVLGIPFPNGNAPVSTVPGDSRGPDGSDVAVRVSVKWTPIENFDALLKVTGNVMNTNGANINQEVYCTRPVATIYTLTGYPSPQSDCSANQTRPLAALPQVFATNYPYVDGGQNYYLSRNLLSSFGLNWTYDKFSLASTTGYYYQLSSDGNNSDTSEYPLVWDVERETYRLVTQELRASSQLDLPINFTGGLYFEHFSRPHFNSPFLLYEGLNPAVDNYTNSEQQIENDGNTYSMFGQARWMILPTLELAGGARWTHENKSAVITQEAVNPLSVFILGPLHPVGSQLAGDYSSTNTSPEATLTWHFDPDQMVYGAYKTGYKSGGIANQAVIPLSTTINDLRFGAEYSKGGEIGYKAELFGHTLRANLTGYRYNYYNLQVSAFDQATISYLLRNAASSRTQGAEAAVEWRAASELTFNATAAYTDAFYENFPGAQCYTAQTAAEGCVNGTQNLSGKPLLRAPKLATDFGGDYRMFINSDWAVRLAADASYNSSYVVDDVEDPFGKQPAYWKVNASLKLEQVNGHFALSVIGRDLNNAYYLVYENDNAVSPYVFTGYYNRPREVILQAEYHY